MIDLLLPSSNQRNTLYHSMIDLLLPSSIGLLCITYPGSLQSRYSKFLISSCKMKGLALAIAIGLACIWSNSNGMHVNVKVGINQSDDPGKIKSKETSFLYSAVHIK